MSDHGTWLRLCREQQARPRHERLAALYGSQGVTIVLCFICAAATGVMFFLWNRLKNEQRMKVWRLYPWFTSLGCIGCILGVNNACLGIKHEQIIIESTLSQSAAEQLAREADASFWNSILVVPNALEVLVVNFALLTVLDRLVHVAFATSSGLNHRRALAKRIVAGIVIALHSISVCFSAASAHYLRQGIPLLSSAAAAVAATDFNTSRALIDEVRRVQLLSNYTKAGRLFCESAALIFMVATFTVVFVVCTRRIREINERTIAASVSRQEAKHAQEMQILDADQEAETISISDSSNSVGITRRVSTHTAELVDNMKDVHQHIFVTVIIVFVSLLCTSICLTIDGGSSLYAVTNYADDGSVIFCDPNAPTRALVSDWLLLSPYFFILGVYLPGPFAVLVALWCMTSKLMLQMIRAQRLRGASRNA